jgi:hypothetical protein
MADVMQPFLFRRPQSLSIAPLEVLAVENGRRAEMFEQEFCGDLARGVVLGRAVQTLGKILQCHIP